MDWLSAAFGSVVGFMPQLLAGLIILVVAYVIGRVLSSVTRRLASRWGFDSFLSRHGLIPKAKPMAGSKGLGTAIFVVVMLIGASATAETWDLELVATGLASTIAYLPHVVAAVVIFGAAWLVAEWLGDRVSQAEESPSMLRGAVKAIILTLGGVMALQELRVAPTFVLIAFTLIVGAIAIACALAFGLGARPVAKDLAQRWSDAAAEKRHEILGSREQAPNREFEEPLHH